MEPEKGHISPKTQNILCVRESSVVNLLPNEGILNIMECSKEEIGLGIHNVEI